MERSWWLCVVRLTTLARCSRAKSGGPMRPLAGKGVRSEAQVKETAAWAEKTVSKRSFDRGPCRVELPGTSHMRDRRITVMSVLVLGLPKISTILYKRPSPAGGISG